MATYQKNFRYLRLCLYFKYLKLSAEYEINKRAWMMSAVFTEWIIRSENNFAVRKTVFSSCQLNLFSATNCRQCCTTTWWRNLEFQFWKLLLRKYFTSTEEKEDFSIDVLDVCNLLQAAWNLTTSGSENV